MLTKLKNNFSTLFREFPRAFWLVVGVSFVDGVGRTLLFPFFPLYITQRFNVGATQAGFVLGIFSVFALVGSFIGGALTDRIGRKKLILAGLVCSALTTLALGLVNELQWVYVVAAISGTFGELAGPAHQAMIADILPEDKRQEGFGVLRVVGNLTWIFGPSIGGLLAGVSFFYLFVSDAVVSCIVAVLFFIFIAETKPKASEAQANEDLLKTFAGYFKVLRDLPFVAFILASILMGMVYIQMYGALSIFLRDQHGINPQSYGLLMSSSGVTVILFQFWMTRVIKWRPPFLMMALGTLFYMVGFSLFGFVAAFWLFLSAIVIVTIGEMIVVPTASALAANFAPEAMRGRYMAVFSLVWAVPAAVGPALAGYILDNYNPNLLWFGGGLVCALAAAFFYYLHLRLGKRKKFAAAEA
ncbi:MAG: MFS transporter [Anaerolineales bacterium]|nr:MFS transporter [Anaerolineales bacterium]MCW5838822.1 MFS transporter [Anaerolineales bacterium]